MAYCFAKVLYADIYSREKSRHRWADLERDIIGETCDNQL